MNSIHDLSLLGWQNYFQQQLSLDELERATICRVVEHHRNEYKIRSESDCFRLPITASLPQLAIGDWVLVDNAHRFIRLLQRKSLFKRKAAGSKLAEQLIAANVDTALIVCSLNDDFNLSRIERYLAMAHEAAVDPVVVLTKLDLCDDAEAKLQAVQRLDPLLPVESVNGLDPLSCECLLAWAKSGQTLVLLGSSGVGKSTLVNTLLGQKSQLTASIRDDDSKGRHTTTSRSMHWLPSGAVLIDSPGMRELQLTDCEEGVRRTFEDIDELARSCKFNDCQHQEEVGCAIQAAIEAGELEHRRLRNYQKLLAEQARNNASLQELRAKDKQFGKMVKSVGSRSRLLKKGY